MRTIGLQTFTIRSWIKQNPDEAMKRMVSLGIHQIEAARMPFDQKMIDILKKYQVSVNSLQITYHKLKTQQETIRHFAAELKCPFLIISVLPLWARIPLIGYSLFSKRVNQLAKSYQAYGLSLGFHHHAYEMKTKKDLLKLDFIFANIDPTVKLVMDTYWVTLMHQDPIMIYNRFKSRIVGVHLRDYGLNHKNTTLGTGTVSFKALIDIIDPKVYLVIEQDAEDPEQAVKEGLRYMEEHCERESI